MDKIVENVTKFARAMVKNLSTVDLDVKVRVEGSRCVYEVLRLRLGASYAQDDMEGWRQLVASKNWATISGLAAMRPLVGIGDSVPLRLATIAPEWRASAVLAAMSQGDDFMLK